MAKNSQMSLNRNRRNENTQSIAHTPIAPFGWLMVAFLLALGAINFADKAVLGLAAVPIIKELHLSPAQYGLLSGSIFWLFSLSSVLVTGWSDRIGTKKVLALLATTWAIVQIATLFVFSFPALLLTRVVLGAGEGPSYGTSVAAATPWLPADRRTFGLAVVTLGSYVGPALFAPLLTFMIVIVGWRSAFALLGVIGIIWLIFWLLIGREPAKESSIPTSEAYMARSGTNWSPIFPVLFSPTVIFSALAGFGIYWASALYLSWNPVYLVTVRHLRLSDPLYIAGITLPYVVGGIALIAVGMLADRIFQRTGSRRSLVYLASALLIASALSLLLAVSVPSTPGAIILFILAPIGVAVPIVSAIITEVAPLAHRGSILGIVVAVFTLPGIIAPLVTGFIIQSAGKNVTMGFQHAYLLASLLLLLTGVAYLAFAQPDKVMKSNSSGLI